MSRPALIFLVPLTVFALTSACQDAALDHYNFGIEAMQRGDTTTALSEFQQSVVERPDDPDAQVNLAVALLGVGQPEQALEHLQIAQRAKPSDVVVHVNMAEAYKALGRTQAARTEYQYALGRDPTMVEAMTGYGEMLVQAGQYREATDVLLKAITIEPHHAAALFQIGTLYMDTDRYLDATHYYLRGLQSQPGSAYGRLGLAEAYLARDLVDDAFSEFQTVYLADTAAVAAMVGIGDCQTRRGNWVQAQRVLERALEREPENARAHKCLGEALAAQGLYQESVAHYRMATRIDNEYADAWMGMGNTLEAAGDLDQAESALKNALLHAPRSADVLYRLGLVYAEKQDPNLARDYYEMALDVAGNDRDLSARIRAALDAVSAPPPTR